MGSLERDCRALQNSVIKRKHTRAKNKYFRVLLTVFIFVLIVLLIKQIPATKQPGTNSKNSVSNANKHVNRIEISGIMVLDFTKNTPSSGSKLNLTTIANTKDYHIFYLSADELFVISITSYPFDQHRPVAENVLLDVLVITREEACGLNVDITTPSFANPDKSGEIYDLSFCSNNN